MDAKLLIKLQTEKAQRFLQEADDMLEQHRWDMAANRSIMPVTIWYMLYL